MRARTLIALAVAVLLGVGAAIATHQMVGAGRLQHAPAANDDLDPGLIP